MTEANAFLSCRVKTLFGPAALGLLLLFVTGCGKTDQDLRLTDDGLFQIRVQLDWRPEPEHGGLYQALVDGYFREEGLAVTLMPGGTNARVTQMVATGQADIGQSASTQVILARSNGFPLTNIAGVFHYIPTGLLMHESNPVEGFEDLDGKRIMARPEAVYIPYLKKRYDIDFEVVPQSFGLAGFLADETFIQEGFYIAEPYFMRREGANVKWLALKDSGYSPYAVLLTNDAFLAEHRERVEAFIRAYLRGWETYLGNEDFGRVHKHLVTINQGLSERFCEFSRNQIMEDRLVRGIEGTGERIGSIDPARIAAEIALMEEIGVLEAGVVTGDDVVADVAPRPAGGDEP